MLPKSLRHHCKIVLIVHVSWAQATGSASQEGEEQWVKGHINHQESHLILSSFEIE